MCQSQECFRTRATEALEKKDKGASSNSHTAVLLWVQFSSVAQLCPTLCDPMNHSTPGLPVHHQLGVHSNLMSFKSVMPYQPSHLLSSPSPPASNPSQHQSLFQWVNSSHEVAKVLEFQLQHHSFQWTPRTDLLQNGLVGSPCSPRDSQESSPTPSSKVSILQCSAFFTVKLSHPYMTTGKTIALTRWTFVGKVTILLYSDSNLTEQSFDFKLSSWWEAANTSITLSRKGISDNKLMKHVSSLYILYYSKLICERLPHPQYETTSISWDSKAVI